MDDDVKILIVDDDISGIEILGDVLDFEGYIVDSAENGLEAIEKVKNNGMKVVLMDFKMPGMNGVEVFREVIKINPELKIIFTTAYYNEETMKAALNEGAFGICHKPLDIPQLLNEIKTAIR